jgi:hypothetical protein
MAFSIFKDSDHQRIYTWSNVGPLHLHIGQIGKEGMVTLAKVVRVGEIVKIATREGNRIRIYQAIVQAIRILKGKEPKILIQWLQGGIVNLVSAASVEA